MKTSKGIQKAEQGGEIRANMQLLLYNFSGKVSV